MNSEETIAINFSSSPVSRAIVSFFNIGFCFKASKQLSEKNSDRVQIHLFPLDTYKRNGNHQIFLMVFA